VEDDFMRKLLLILSAAAIGLPGLAAAQSGGASAATNHCAAGYYDSDGVWHATNGAYGAAGYYDRYGHWVGGDAARGAYSLNDLYARESRIANRIRAGDNSGALSRDQANRDLIVLERIRQYQQERVSENGYLSYDARMDVSGRLETLNNTVSNQWSD
jgi:hypothetical protein